MALALKIIFGVMGLSIVIVAHELGHFIAARLSGVEVLTFSIGWGKKLLSIKKGRTEFCISLFPLGGYCRLKGEQSLIQAWEQEMDEVPKEKGALYSAHPLKRIFISLMGPFFNLVFTMLVSASLLWIGYNIQYNDPRIVLASEIREDGIQFPADRAGLRTGDLIISIDGEMMDQFSQLEKKVSVSSGKELVFLIRRDNELLSIPVVPEINKSKGSGFIGVYPFSNPVIAQVASPSSAEASGLKAGDRILSVDGHSISSSIEASKYLWANGVSHTLGVMRNGEEISLEIFAPPEGEYGIEFEYKVKRTEKIGPFRALARGTVETIDSFVLTIKSFKLLFSGIDLKNAVSGPLRITYYTGQVAGTILQDGLGPGLVYFFQFLGFISIALCFMNLLPIPVLDGGQILLFIFEMVKKSPLRPKMIYRYQLIGTIVVFGLILLATTNDILFFAAK